MLGIPIRRFQALNMQNVSVGDEELRTHRRADGAPGNLRVDGFGNHNSRSTKAIRKEFITMRKIS